MRWVFLPGLIPEVGYPSVHHGGLSLLCTMVVILLCTMVGYSLRASVWLFPPCISVVIPPYPPWVTPSSPPWFTPSSPPWLFPPPHRGLFPPLHCGLFPLRFIPVLFPLRFIPEVGIPCFNPINPPQRGGLHKEGLNPEERERGINVVKLLKPAYKQGVNHS